MHQIQGRNAVLRFYLNGQVVKGITVKKFDWEGEDEIRKRDLVGEKRQSAQHLIDGFKGTFECDISNKRHHEIIKYLNETDNTNTQNYELALQVTETYKDNSRCQYRFVRVTMKIPKTSVEGRKEDAKYTVEWFAEDIVYLT